MNAPLILSTKKLTLSQKELLLNAGMRLIDYNAIEVALLKFTIPQAMDHAIFTSQNGVRAYLENNYGHSTITHCYCVGSKTKALLEENGQKVVKMEENSEKLAHFILEHVEKGRFYYFCGSHRRDELPELLKSSKIELFEVKSYQITPKPRHFGQKMDGILFFSPSGVQSYLLENEASSTTVFCIGETTATEARNHFSEVVVANSHSVESVIAKSAKTLRKQISE
ncbi:MAG: uroporphyrinogen-III synthase [Bacteroidota bacterium]